MPRNKASKRQRSKKTDTEEKDKRRRKYPRGSTAETYKEPERSLFLIPRPQNEGRGPVRAKARIILPLPENSSVSSLIKKDLHKQTDLIQKFGAKRQQASQKDRSLPSAEHNSFLRGTMSAKRQQASQKDCSLPSAEHNSILRDNEGRGPVRAKARIILPHPENSSVSSLIKKDLHKQTDLFQKFGAKSKQASQKDRSLPSAEQNSILRDTMSAKRQQVSQKDRSLPSAEHKSILSDTMSPAELEELEESGTFFNVSEETKRRIHAECQDMLIGPFMMQKVCAVCDTWTREQLCPVREESEDLYTRCKIRLAPCSDLIEDLRQFYDVSTYIPALKNTLLSVKGIETLEEDKNQFRVRICNSCYSSLSRGARFDASNPPKFSIANGFAIGRLPIALQDVTLTERRLTSLTSLKGHTIVARGGKHKSIKNHILVFSSQPDAIKEGLDDLLENENKLLLIFTNPMTDAQRRVRMKRYEARRGKVEELLAFYLEQNVLYKNLSNTGPEMTRFKNIPYKSDVDFENVNVVYNVENRAESEGITGDQSNVRRPAVFDKAQVVAEETLIHQNASVFTAQEAAEEVTTLKMATAQVIDVQQAGKLLPASNPNFFGLLYPHLFPFGHGHPDYKRKVNVSLQECVKYYLKLSSRTFAQDETFPLVAFDIVSRKRAISHIGLSCRLNPKEMEQLDEVSAEELAQQLDQDSRKREALRSGHVFTEPEKSRKGKVFLRRVQAVLGKNFATNEERRVYQRKAWNMAAKFHSAAMFITVTPNENGNATVAFFSGDMNKENLSTIKENDIPGNAARVEIAGKDPVACDTFLTNTLDIIIDKMIGFDKKSKLPKKSGGLFGVPRAFMGGIESQGKGTLYVHLIVFLAGFPKDSDEMVQRVLNDELFQSRVFSFHDSVICSTGLQCESELYCPSCSTTGSIKSVRYNEIAYSNNMRSDTPVATSKCELCSKTFGGDEVIRESVKNMKMNLLQKECGHLLNNNSTVMLSDSENDNCVALSAAVPTIPSLPHVNASDEELLAYRIFILELLLLNQNHRWKHATSCFKKSSNCKDGRCRYDFPRMTHIRTEAEDTGRIISKRTVGSEYINSYNEILLQVVRSNHDVRLLLCCAYEIYYAIKYVVKDQNSIDNISAITLSSYTKKLEKERNSTLRRSSAQTVLGRIASMAYARSELIEVGAVTATHYLLHGTTFVSSHDFQTLHLGRHLNDLNNSENELRIIPYGNAYIAFNVTSHYKLRPLELESECLYSFTESFNISKDIPKNIDENTDCMRLHPDHPFYATKVVKRRKVKVVADIVGPRIPDLYDTSQEDMEKYSQIALVLFTPHRCTEDILSGLTTFTEAFIEFKRELAFKRSQAKSVLSNMQQYYIGKRRAQEMREGQLQDSADDVNASLDSDSNEYQADNLNISDEECTDTRNEFLPIDIERFSAELEPSCVQNVLNNIVRKIDKRKGAIQLPSAKDVCSSEGMKRKVRNTIPKVRPTCFSANWPTCSDFSGLPLEDRLSKKNVKSTFERLKLAEVDEKMSTDLLQTDSPDMQEREQTLVRLLEDAIRSSIESEQAGKRIVSSDDQCSLVNPSLEQVARMFTLNERQKIAFYIAGRFLLDSFKRSILRKPPGKPLRMHISGEGGTGKSRVIDSLRFLTKAWGKPESIVTVAPTGIAAVLINGETAHSKFQLVQNRKPTLRQIEEWSKVHMIIWDEISMTGQSLFAKAFKKIKMYLGTSEGNDPRVHILTAGDFAQLPPCFEKYIFSAPARLEQCYTNDRREIKVVVGKYSTTENLRPQNVSGYQLWQSFRIVVKLMENMRHHLDPSYGLLLRRLRIGTRTEDDFNILNSRYLDPSTSTSPVHEQFHQLQLADTISFPIAVQGNISRHSINWLGVAQISKCFESEAVPIICPAQFNATKRGTKPTLDQMIQLLELGDNKLQRLSPLLPIFPGMPLYVTQNIDPKIGLANGSTGNILGCQFPEDTMFSSTEVQSVPMQLASNLPEIVYVSVDQAKLKERFPGVREKYPKNTIPILPYTLTVRVNCMVNRNFSIRMTQIPISPSFAATTHKMQGTTCKAILSYVFDEAGKQPTSLYVLASRVTSLNGLFLCQKLTSEDFKYFRPSKEILEEEERLETLCNRTLSNYINGALNPDEVNKSLELEKRDKNMFLEEVEIDLCLLKKSSPSALSCSETENRDNYLQKKTISEVSPFASLHSYFNANTVRRMQACHEISMRNMGNALYALPFIAIVKHNVAFHSELWTVLDVPGDGNCWIYATVLSIFYGTLSQGTSLSIEPQNCRNRLSSLLLNVSQLYEQTRTHFLRHMNLCASHQGKALQQVAMCAGYRNSLQMMAALLRIGTPGSCLWAGDTGEELSLLSVILNQNIVTYYEADSQESQSRVCLMSNIGGLCAGPIYSPYPNVSIEEPVVNFSIPILLRAGNHFQAMIPPTSSNLSSA